MRRPDDDPLFERFQLIVNGPALFHTLATGIDLGLFTFLAGHPQADFDAIQRFVGLPAHKLRILLLALCSTQLVKKEGGRYSNTTIADRYLASDGPESWKHIVLGARTFFYPAFAHTTAALRAGTNADALAEYPGDERTLYQRIAHDPKLEASFHALTTALTLQAIDDMFDAPELGSVHHLLDVGGGEGTNARRFAELYPHAKVTIFDLPTVVQRATEAVPDALAARISVHPGDMFEDAFPRGLDGILYSNIVEGLNEDRILPLLAKAYDALAPGGRLFIYGINASDDETSGIDAARLSLYVNVLARGTGMAYPPKDYHAWMTQAGFTDIRSYSGLSYDHGLHIGTKPPVAS